LVKRQIERDYNFSSIVIWSHRKMSLRLSISKKNGVNNLKKVYWECLKRTCTMKFALLWMWSFIISIMILWMTNKNILKQYPLLIYHTRWLISLSKRPLKFSRKKSHWSNLKRQWKFSATSMVNMSIFCICSRKWVTKIKMINVIILSAKTQNIYSWVITSTEENRAAKSFASYLL